MNRRSVGVALTLALIVPGCVARSTKEPQEWMREGKPERAFETWKKRAEEGDVEATYRLGNMYMLGLGTPKDEMEGVRMYREAARQGSVEARRTLASTYLTGRGRAEDDPDAERWLIEAVEKRAVSSKYRLGVMYLTGDGIRKSRREALLWLRRAAEEWGESTSGLIERLDKDDLLQEAATIGLAEAQFAIGKRFAQGLGVPRSDTEAAKWIYMAANKGLPQAQISLGMAFGKGLGVPQDDAEAARWFRKAAEQGDRVGQYQIGIVLRDGRGVPRDPVEAHMWFNLAAAQGHGGAKQNMEMLAEFMQRIDLMRAERMAVNRWRAALPTKRASEEKTAVEETAEPAVVPQDPSDEAGEDLTARSEDGE